MADQKVDNNLIMLLLWRRVGRGKEEDGDCPAYGVTGPARPGSSPAGDRRLAQSAQMYHYQVHQRITYFVQWYINF